MVRPCNFYKNMRNDILDSFCALHIRLNSYFGCRCAVTKGLSGASIGAKLHWIQKGVKKTPFRQAATQSARTFYLLHSRKINENLQPGRGEQM